MGLDKQGRFQSDKHLDLPVDRIRLNLGNLNSYRALMQLADDYDDIDPELSRDLRKRMSVLHPDKHDWPLLNQGAPPYLSCKKCPARLFIQRWFGADNKLRVRPMTPYPLPTCAGTDGGS